MNSSNLHIVTAWAPMYSIIFSGLFLALSLLLKKDKIFKLSMYLLIFTGLISLITGALGGSSMSRVRKLPDINHAALHLHAWSAFGACAFAIILGLLAINRLRSKTKPDLITNIMMVIIGSLVFAFLITSINFASQIRLVH